MSERAVPGVGARLLGPLLLRVDGVSVSLGPPKQRALLTLLLLWPNEIVSVDTMVTELWGDRPPRSAAPNLRTYLAGIRSVLGTAGQDRLVSRPNGHLLRVCDEELDVARFRALATLGRTALAAREFDDAVRHFDDALGLWRGQVAEDVPAGAVTRVRRAHLAEELSAVREDRLAARLERGETDGALRRQLRELVAAEPLRERGWVLLMTVLRRSGDPAGALGAYAQARAAFVEHLGIEPGAELQRLQRATLDGAGPAVAARHTADRSAPSATPADDAGPCGLFSQLPPDTGGFTGRTAELAALGRAAERGARVITVTGPAGIGKTALAVRWAHSVRDRYPDGQLYVDLRGFGPGEPAAPSAVLGSLLRMVGVPADRIPVDLAGRSGVWRSVLADRSALLVLDNARDHEQVRPLLPTTGPVVVSSRNQLRALVVREGAHRVPLGALSPPDALAVLALWLDTAQRTDEPADAAGAVAELCERVPLALRIVAERASRRSGPFLAELAERFSGRPLDLDALRSDDDDGSDVRSVLSWSYRALEEPTARIFRLLGLMSCGDTGVPAVAAVAGITLGEAQVHLDRLTAVNLLEERAPHRYGFPGLVAGFAVEQLRTVPLAEHRAAVIRIVDWYVRSFVDHTPPPPGPVAAAPAGHAANA